MLSVACPSGRRTHNSSLAVHATSQNPSGREGQCGRESANMSAASAIMAHIATARTTGRAALVALMSGPPLATRLPAGAPRAVL